MTIIKQKKIVDLVFLLFILLSYSRFVINNTASKPDDYNWFIYSFFHGLFWHLIIGTLYFIWIVKNDEYRKNELIVTKFIHKTRYYFNYIKWLSIDTMVFVLSLFGLFIFTSQILGFELSKIINWNTVLIFLPILSVFFLITVIFASVNLTVKNNKYSYLFIYVVLSVDCFANIGYLRFDYSFFYKNMLSVHFALNDSDLLILYKASVIPFIMSLIIIYTINLYLKTEKRRILFNKLLINKYLNSFYALPIGILIGLYACQGDMNNIEEILIYGYGGLLPQDMISGIDLIIFATPIIFQFFLFGSIISDDKESVSVYIFTRTINRKGWYIKKLKIIILSAISFNLNLFLGTTIIAFLLGVKIASIELFMITILSLIATFVIINSLFVLLINVLSIKFELKTVFYSVVIMYFLSQIITGLFPQILNGVLIKANPATQSILIWHDIKILKETMAEVFESFIFGFSPLYSFFYATGLYVILILYGQKKFEKLNLL